MSATNNFEVANVQRTYINSKQGIVVFKFGKAQYGIDKQMFLFGGYLNNSVTFLCYAGFRLYEWSSGQYGWGKCITIPYYINIAGNQKPLILVSNSNIDQVWLRFDNIPAYSVITCIDSGTFILKSIEEVV